MYRVSSRVQQRATISGTGPVTAYFIEEGVTEGMMAFTEAATLEGWGTSEIMSVLIFLDNDNWVVVKGTYYSAPSPQFYYSNSAANPSRGTIPNGAEVEVSIVMDKNALIEVSSVPTFKYKTVSGSATTYDIDGEFNGYTVIVAPNSSLTFTLKDNVLNPFQCVVIREGGGEVKFELEGSAQYLNYEYETGGVDMIEIPEPFSSVFIYKKSGDFWNIINGVESVTPQ